MKCNAIIDSQTESRFGEQAVASARGAGGGSPIPYRLTDKARAVPKKLILRGALEKDIQFDILHALGVNVKGPDGKKTGLYVTPQRDGMFWRANSGGGRPVRGIVLSPAGTADIIGHVAGCALYLEVKREKEQQEPTQVWWQGWVEITGGIYRVVRSVSEALAVVEEVRRA